MISLCIAYIFGGASVIVFMIASQLVEDARIAREHDEWRKNSEHVI